MKYISRTSAVAAAAALAAPAFADAGSHHDLSVLQTIAHWVSQPSHGFALIIAAAAVTGAVIYSRRQRG